MKFVVLKIKKHSATISLNAMCVLVFLKVELLKGMIFVENESLKKKVLCSVLAASVFGVMYAGDVQAASLNGKPIKDGIVTNDTVHENGSSKFVIGQGNVSIQTNASVGIILDKIQKGESLNSILGPVGPETGDKFYTHAPITGVVGGEGQLDKNIVGIVNKVDGVLDKPIIGNIVSGAISPGMLEKMHKISNIDTIIKAGFTESDAVIEGSTRVEIGGSDSDDNITSPVVLGAVGGDLSVSMGLNGSITLVGKYAEQDPLSVNRTGNVDVVLKSGNVFGGVGGSAAIAVGNANIKDEKGLLKFDLKTDGNAKTTLNGDVTVKQREGANSAAWATGGGSIAVGGKAESVVNGNTNLIIDSKVDSSKLEGITVGAAGGGLSVSTLGGKSDSTVSGTSNVSVNDGLAFGLAGGGVAASVDATFIGGKIKGHEIGNNDGTSDIDFIKDLGLGTAGTIEFKEAYNGGTATATTGDTKIDLNGTTTAFGVVVGGVAGSVHTYNVRTEGGAIPDGMSVGDVIGSSVSNAKTGKTTINVNVSKADGSKLTPEEKSELINAIKKLPRIMNKDTNIITALQEATKGMAGKGAVIAVTGGGLAVSYTDLNQGKVGEDVGAKATVENAGTELKLNSGYVVGAFGGGVAVANRESDAAANTTDTITINVNGAEVVGLFANGGAAHRQATKEGGSANVSATDTVVNVNYGSVDGLFGGGLAVRNGDYKDNTAKVVTSGTSTINIKGNVNKLGYEHMGGIFDKVGFGTEFNAVKDLAKDAAVVAGGVAAGKGSHVEVNGSVINIKQGAEIDGDVVAGGIAADGGTSLVKDCVINLNGGTVVGQLNGQGLGDGATVEKSILNVTGNNTLAALADKSKISGFNEVNFAADSVTTITGLKAGNTVALIDGNGNKITVNEGAKLDISKLDKVNDKSYFIAGNYSEESRLWNDDELAYDRTEGFAKVEETQDGKYNVTYKELGKLTEEENNKAAASMEESLGQFGGQVRGIIDGIIRNGQNTNDGADKFFKDLTSGIGDATADLRTGMLFGEAAGVTSNSVSMATDFADNAALRLSFTQDKVNGEDKVAEEGGVWAKYIHNKHEVNGASSSMGGLSSSNDYDGVMVGAELAKKGDYQYGIAFAYGDGDGSGMGVENDFDTWGVNLYSNLKKDDVNIIADLGYSKSSYELTGKVEKGTLTADRDVNILTAGVRAEKLYVNGDTQVVPYVGLRYFNIDGDSYTTNYNGKAAFQNEADSQNVWTLPVGVSLRNETVTKSGWRVTPKVDLAYIFAFGDTDNSVTVNTGSGVSTLSYDVMDRSSWLASAALEAGKGDWTYGVGYSYQKGSDVENNKWFVNVNYSF